MLKVMGKFFMHKILKKIAVIFIIIIIFVFLITGCLSPDLNSSTKATESNTVSDTAGKQDIAGNAGDSGSTDILSDETSSSSSSESTTGDNNNDKVSTTQV